MTEVYPLFLGFGVVGLVWAFWWWSEDYMARKHMREAVREVNAEMEWRRNWHPRVPYPPPALARAWDRLERKEQ